MNRASSWRNSGPPRIPDSCDGSSKLSMRSALPNASPAQSEDVYQTLLLPPIPEKGADGQK